MHNVQGFVTGRVQGVGFRYFVMRHAQAAGVTGFVRNLPDGRVEFLLQGEPAAVETVLRQIHQGPSYSRVDTVELVEPSSNDPHPDFLIR